MSEEHLISFDSLLGTAKLDAVDYLENKLENRYAEIANVCLFRLNGIVYKAVENPDDGYRSSLEKLVIEPNAQMQNIFPPVDVIIRMKNSDIDVAEWERGRSHDILMFFDRVTALPILEIGTDNTDDYYPSFVANFRPENMAINQLLGDTIYGRESSS